MKKGKARPYVKRESKPWNKLAILAVAAFMVGSGIYYSGVQNSGVGDGGSVKVRRYGIEQARDDAYAFVGVERKEVVAMLGDRAAARLTQETVLGLLNTSIGTVYKVEAEEASNSFILFRFYATDPEKALYGLKPHLDGLLGDYALYRVYAGTQPGNFSGGVVMELLSPANTTLATGSLVKTLLLRKTIAQDEGSVEELVGFVKNVVPSGPTVRATVNGVDGYAVWGLTGVRLDAGELEGSFGGDVAYQPPAIAVEGVVNETALNVTGVELAFQGGYTIVEPVNASMGYLESRLVEMGLNHTLLKGTVTVYLPLNADLGLAGEKLTGMNVTNLTVQKLGRVTLPEEVVMDDMLVPIKNNKNATSVLFLNATAGEEVDVNLMAISLGDQLVVNVRQV